MKRFWFLPLLILSCSTPSLSPPSKIDKEALLPQVNAVSVPPNVCVVVWSEADGALSVPANACVTTNGNLRTAWWDPVPGVTNYILGWSRSPITNLVPSSNILWTNTGMNTTQSFFVVPPATVYGLIFLQASTNGVDFYDLTPDPYLRLTNGQGVLPWQWFRSRTEMTTNWR